MIKLYGSGPSRWVRPYWTLQELGLPFEPVVISIRSGDAEKPEFKAINPFGKVPALVDGDVKLFESAAICQYLCDKAPEKELLPKAGTVERALCDQWMFFAVADFEQPLWRITKHRFLYAPEKRSEAEIELAKDDFRDMAQRLEKALPGDCLVGGRFSAADIVLTYVMRWSKMFGLLSDYPRLSAYHDQHTSRPAFPAQLFQD